VIASRTVASIDHTKGESRAIVIPGARLRTIVASRVALWIVTPRTARKTPQIHMSWPLPLVFAESESG
jgi:hypothetical protein